MAGRAAFCCRSPDGNLSNLPSCAPLSFALVRRRTRSSLCPFGLAPFPRVSRSKGWGAFPRRLAARPKLQTVFSNFFSAIFSRIFSCTFATGCGPVSLLETRGGHRCFHKCLPPFSRSPGTTSAASSWSAFRKCALLNCSPDNTQFRSNILRPKPVGTQQETPRTPTFCPRSPRL